MTQVYWLEQTALDVPVEDDWLGDYELHRLRSIRFPKRRADWRLGRWTAKTVLATLWGAGSDDQSLSKIEIRAAASGAPEVFVNGAAVTTTISLTHRDGLAACAVIPGRRALGCDLETIEPRSPAFICDYFTLDEQDFIRSGDSGLRATLLWSAKESALKAMHLGLRADTRSVMVSIKNEFAKLTEANAALWRPLRVRGLSQCFVEGFWQAEDRFVRTIVADTALTEITFMQSQHATELVEGD